MHLPFEAGGIANLAQHPDCPGCIEQGADQHRLSPSTTKPELAKMEGPLAAFDAGRATR